MCGPSIICGHWILSPKYNRILSNSIVKLKFAQLLLQNLKKQLIYQYHQHIYRSLGRKYYKISVEEKIVQSTE